MSDLDVTRETAGYSDVAAEVWTVNGKLRIDIFGTAQPPGNAHPRETLISTYGFKLRKANPHALIQAAKAGLRAQGIRIRDRANS